MQVEYINLRCTQSGNDPGSLNWSLVALVSTHSVSTTRGHGMTGKPIAKPALVVGVFKRRQSRSVEKIFIPH